MYGAATVNMDLILDELKNPKKTHVLVQHINCLHHILFLNGKFIVQRIQNEHWQLVTDRTLFGWDFLQRNIHVASGKQLNLTIDKVCAEKIMTVNNGYILQVLKS